MVIKNSIGDGLLGDIKECPLKLYYLYNKSSKKLRSLKELISELEGVIGLNDNFIDDGGIAPTKSFGTRLVGRLVNALQRAINKFGIYLKVLENLSNGEKKSSEKARLFGYINKWKDYRYLLGMGFFLHLLMPLKELSLGWQKNFVSAVIKKKTRKVIIEHLNAEEYYVKTILDNTHDDCYQTFHFNNVERTKTTIPNNAIIWCDNVTDCVRNCFDEDTNKPIIDAASMILNSSTILQVESSNEEVSEDTTSENEDDGAILKQR